MSQAEGLSKDEFIRDETMKSGQGISIGLRTAHPPRFRTCVEIIVVEKFLFWGVFHFLLLT